MLNQNSTIPLYEQVKEAIKLKIEQKEWKENTRVPSETELMKIYEVSRVTVRNALALLVDEGYLEKKQGIGTFVSKPRIKKIIFHRASFTQSCAGAGLVPGTQVLKKEVVEGKSNYRKSLQLEADDIKLAMVRCGFHAHILHAGHRLGAADGPYQAKYDAENQQQQQAAYQADQDEGGHLFHRRSAFLVFSVE